MKLDIDLSLQDEVEVDEPIEEQDDFEEEFFEEIQSAENAYLEELRILRERLERQIQCSVTTAQSHIFHNFENNNSCTLDVIVLLYNHTDTDCLVSIKKIEPDNMPNVSYLTASTNNTFTEKLITLPPKGVKEIPLHLVISSPGTYYLEETFQYSCSNDTVPYAVDQILKDECVLYVDDTLGQN